MSVVIDQVQTEGYVAYNGDSCEVIKGIPSDSIGFMIYSPPFASLFSYSDNLACMSNCKSDTEFFEHYKYLIGELYRVLKPGRIAAVHVMQLTKSMQKDGVIGLRDFRGDVIRAHESSGFVYHSEVCIWKCPVVAVTRTKALGLLHKQLTKDSSRSRQGLADYVVVFRKPGENDTPIAGELNHYAGDDFTPSGGNLSIDIWQRYASPVWMDIRQGRTLNNYREGKDERDVRHLCPLQLDVIERCLQLWSTEGDVVLSPFMGIGSEGVCSIEMGRKFVGIELKKSYFDLATKNLAMASVKANRTSLFAEQE